MENEVTKPLNMKNLVVGGGITAAQAPSIWSQIITKLRRDSGFPDAQPRPRARVEKVVKRRPKTPEKQNEHTE